MKRIFSSRVDDLIWKIRIGVVIEFWGETTEEGWRLITKLKDLTVNGKPASRVDWLIYWMLFHMTYPVRCLLDQVAKTKFKCSCGWSVQGLEMQVKPLVFQHAEKCELIWQRARV